MIFEQDILQPSLDRNIESIIYFKDFTPEHSIERLVPTGHVFIVFELDNIARNVYDNKTLNPIKQFTKVWLSGIHRNFISISSHEKSEMFIIQFKPTGAFPFLHTSMHLFREKIISATDVFGIEILKLRDAIIQSKSPQEKFSTAKEWLLNRFEIQKEASSNLLAFTSKLQKESLIHLKEIMASYPYTQKQLIEHFKKYVGLTPKQFHRIIKFNEVFQKINKKEKIYWADIAYDCGYSDQSHFIKEFFLFSGFKPQEFLKKDFSKDSSNFFPLN